MTLALRCRRDPDADASVGADLHARPVRVARLRQAQGPLLGRLGQRDVAHVRDRRLDHAGEADTDEPALRARAGLLLAPLAVAGELQDVVQARRVVPGVVERSRGGAVGELGGGDEIAAGEVGRVDAEAPGRDRHRPLEGEVELGAAEAPVEPAGAAVRHDDAVPGGDVANPVGPGERAVHAVERGRLGCADVGADVLHGVVAEPQQLAVLGERRLHARATCGRACARRQVLDPVFDPANGDAQLHRREPHEHDVGVDRRLDAVAAARVRRGEQPELRAGQAERGSRDAVEREGPLEVRPGRQRPGGGVPVGDDGVTLDRGGAPAWECEALPHDEVGAVEGRVRVAVREAAVGGDEARRLGCDEGIHDRVERLVVDLDELERVLGRIAIACDDDGQGLACVPCDLARGGVVRDRALDTGGKRSRHREDVGPCEDADHAGELERRAGVETGDTRMPEL